MQNDFNHRILDEAEHRPWPMPDAPWTMTQTWHDLLFAHWPVDAARLASKLPPGIELDTFDGQGWLGIVPFRMPNVAPRLVPALPWISAFPELNVRTYVRYHDTPGVFFFSLDAGNPVAARVGRRMFHLPYFCASMECTNEAGIVRYRSARLSPGETRAEFVADYGPAGPPGLAREESLEYFLTERYCLFTAGSDWHAHRIDIHHPPWPLQSAHADIRVNTMADASGIRLPAQASLLHFARRQDVVAWPPARA